MISYLVNATIIWAISLLFYELMLKKETWHSWNRAYLLSAIIAGLLIPAISVDEQTWQTVSKPVSMPVYKLVELKQTFITDNTVFPVHHKTLPAAPAGYHINWWWAIYLTGVAVGLFLLIKDIAKIVSCYRKAIKTKTGRYTIVECGKMTSPYSLFHFIFLGNRDAYSKDELEMILQHEYRHADKLHSIDLLMISLLQIACWFHPFIYLFKKRIQLLHEYQADEIARNNYTAYGTFLVEQHLIAYSTPSIAHSFHSPIKNRIIMLTKKTSARKQLTKYMITIPMAAVFMIACTRTNVKPTVQATPKETQPSIVNLNGHSFEMSQESIQEIAFSEPGKSTPEMISMSVTPSPVKMDGLPIFGANKEHLPKESTFQPPVFEGSNLGAYLVSAHQQLFDQLEDGTYSLWLNDLVIDKEGKLVYHTNTELVANDQMTQLHMTGDNKAEMITSGTPGKPQTVIKEIKEKMDAALVKNTRFKPGTVNGKPVAAYYDFTADNSSNIIVSNHHARYAGSEEMTVSFSQPGH